MLFLFHSLEHLIDDPILHGFLPRHIEIPVGETLLTVNVLLWDPKNALDEYVNHFKTNWSASGSEIVTEKGRDIDEDWRAVQFVIRAPDQETFYLSQEGVLDQALYRVLVEALSAGRTTPGFNWYWEQRRHYFTDEFQAFVDSLDRQGAEAAIIYQK